MNEFDRLHALSKRLRETYKPGVRIELNHMCSDPQPIPDGSRGNRNISICHVRFTISVVVGT